MLRQFSFYCSIFICITTTLVRPIIKGLNIHSIKSFFQFLKCNLITVSDCFILFCHFNNCFYLIKNVNDIQIYLLILIKLFLVVKVLDVRIHRPTAVINLRYGTTLVREHQRLLHHCKTAALRKAWHRERDALRNNVLGTWDWTQQEADEILKQGAAGGYDGEYIRDVDRYPELAEDPFNIRFVKKAQSRR